MGVITAGGDQLHPGLHRVWRLRWPHSVRVGMAHACELCGMSFDTQRKLDTHHSKFCQGSVLHKTLLSKRKEARGAIASALDEDSVNALSRGLASLSDDVVGMSVSELKAKVNLEAVERTAERESAAAAAERAAVRLKEQRAKAEVQQQVIESQLAAQRTVELQARVQLRAAERMAEAAELKAKSRQQERELAELQRKREELDAKRAALDDDRLGVQTQLAQLHAGTAPASQAILEARTQVAAASMATLSPEAEAQRAALLVAQAEQTRENELTRHRLLMQQTALDKERRELQETAALEAGEATAGPET